MGKALPIPKSNNNREWHKNPEQIWHPEDKKYFEATRSGRNKVRIAGSWKNVQA